MFAGWSLLARIVAPLALLVLLLGGAWGYGARQHRAGLLAGRVEVRAEWDAARLQQREVDAAERDRRITEQTEAVHAAQTQTLQARADAAAARRAGDGLQQRFAAAVERGCDPGAASRGEAAASATDLPADVFGRVRAAAEELAAVADERGIAGSACERAYGALGGP